MTRRARFCRGFGWRCAVLRQLQGLSQQQAAEKAGITPASWQRVEAGSVYSHDFTRHEIMQAFYSHWHWLFTGEHEAA
jgi:transcriptional regulator with XRE-family HTH domain